jgi:flagellar biosynthesis protein FliQ
MTEQKAEKIKTLIDFVDANFKHRRSRDVFRIILPAILILAMLFVIVFLLIYQWTEMSLLSWTPGVVSIIAIIISFNSYIKTSVQSFNKELIRGLAAKLREHLDDKSDKTFYLLIPLVALKQNNYPMKLSVLYDIDREMFKPEKLMEYYSK